MDEVHPNEETQTGIRIEKIGYYPLIDYSEYCQIARQRSFRTYDDPCVFSLHNVRECNVHLYFCVMY